LTFSNKRIKHTYVLGEIMHDTKDRILDAAERLFAERGYDATSLRAITAEAAVNLAAVNYHFTSKEMLLQALFSRRLSALNRERLERLDACEREAGGKQVPLEKLLQAFLEPMVRLKTEESPGGRAFGMLLGRLYSWPSSSLAEVLVQEIRTLAGRFADAFHRTLPGLTETELYWRVFFAIGATAHMLTAPDLLKAISGGACDPADTDTAFRELIAFILAGFKAPVTARRQPPRKGGNSKSGPEAPGNAPDLLHSFLRR
jgi:AcrR family transcriptional regulator